MVQRQEQQEKITHIFVREAVNWRVSTGTTIASRIDVYVKKKPNDTIAEVSLAFHRNGVVASRVGERVLIPWGNIRSVHFEAPDPG